MHQTQWSMACLVSKMKEFASLCFFKRTIILNYGTWQGNKIIILNYDRRQSLLTLDEISPNLRNLQKWLNIPSKSIRFLKLPYTEWASTSGTWTWPHCEDSLITQHIKRQMKSTSGKFYQPPLSRRRRPSGLLKNYCSKWGHVARVVPQSSLMCFHEN